ncbi:ubiquitin-associated and SH3 domain-containing protein A isoform X2 [Rhinopithecus roxellana]|uniref:ubiquitin-associated and SH3 domain-containing protein A isoform X2 n=1 Tax=Rhinopithecus roxellana TaxID=61622 RepID=UPI0012372351|nr:ubiquitin-associated and SH3 domain-containing protein A isoform X2 [Rhinopithecus roxellana]
MLSNTNWLKALAATGRKTAEEALVWLHDHCNDPSLDDPIPQEYALFLCPTGPLLEKLQEFWRESKRQCAKNRAHEVFPHVTLCDFFTCEDQKVECLYEALKRAGDRLLGSFPVAVPLALHSSISYLGFFINGSPADVIREFAMTFATEASLLADCSVKPCTKQLHLTLAHKFYPHHQRTLEQLARAIPLGHSCQWTAALYSRDMRFVHYQTLRALFQYKPQNVDELTLSPGDYIFVDPTQQDEASEGWVIGISQRTGCRGFLPENYTDRASESDTWVKHRMYTFSLATDLNSRKDSEASSRCNGEFLPQTARSLSSLQALQATVERKSVLVVRHGERVDQIFGKSWLQQCSTPDGKYYRPDLNFPCSLPRRSRGIKDFENDPPLSSCGIFQSRIAGDALLDSGIRISSVFASPALRCVQTAKLILEELKLEKKIKIRVEPGIFEWTKWEAGKTTPTLMSLEELKEANFNIDTGYSFQHKTGASLLTTSLPGGRAILEEHSPSPANCSRALLIPTKGPGQQPLHLLLPGPHFPCLPSCQPRATRSTWTGARRAWCKSSTPVRRTVFLFHTAGAILIVSHGSALDSCTRPLLGLPPRECGDFAQLVRKIPSLGMCFCEENKEEGKWELVNPPVKTLTHGANAAFNWRNWISGN